jgi:hypothetical protein
MKANDDLEIFLHGGDKPQVVTAGYSDVLHEVLVKAGVLREGDKEVFVFVGECEDALSHGDDFNDGEDDHKPVEVHLTLEELDLRKHPHVHVHRCRRVAGEVNFGSKSKKHKFSPAATVGTVTEWARRKFRLDPASAAEYVLQICGTTEQPRSDVHLGELVKSECTLCFDLVKEVTPQG